MNEQEKGAIMQQMMDLPKHLQELAVSYVQGLSAGMAIAGEKDEEQKNDKDQASA